MRAAFALVLIIGLALAGTAVYMIQEHIAKTETLLANERALNEKAGKLVEVFVFSKEMKYGDPLAEEDVQVIYWPEKALPAGIFRDKAVLFPEGNKGPRFVRRPVIPFEPVLDSRVTEPGELAGLTAKLEAGKRAFSIKIVGPSSVGDFVQPDMFVDILWTGEIPGTKGEVTRLIESSIQVIAVDQAFNDGQETAGTAQSVTLAASPEQVARLTQAQATGRLQMSLVGSEAEYVTDLIEVDNKSLLGIVEEAPVVEAPKEEEKICKIKSRKGSEIIETIIPCND